LISGPGVLLDASRKRKALRNVGSAEINQETFAIETTGPRPGRLRSQDGFCSPPGGVRRARRRPPSMTSQTSAKAAALEEKWRSLRSAPCISRRRHFHDESSASCLFQLRFTRTILYGIYEYSAHALPSGHHKNSGFPRQPIAFGVSASKRPFLNWNGSNGTSEIPAIFPMPRRYTGIRSKKSLRNEPRPASWLFCACTFPAPAIDPDTGSCIVP